MARREPDHDHRQDRFQITSPKKPVGNSSRLWMRRVSSSSQVFPVMQTGLPNPSVKCHFVD
jgi:hypothetical protein